RRRRAARGASPPGGAAGGARADLGRGAPRRSRGVRRALRRGARPLPRARFARRRRVPARPRARALVIALPHVPGFRLERALGRALALVRDAARGVARLHREGLYHRDLKPGNLLLGADGRVRLADFGIARPLEGTVTAAGSPAFAAPEVIAGRRDADGRRVD